MQITFKQSANNSQNQVLVLLYPTDRITNCRSTSSTLSFVLVSRGVHHAEELILLVGMIRFLILDSKVCTEYTYCS